MTMEKWYRKTGEQGDVVISTRIRLARNLQRVPFPDKMTAEQKCEIIDSVKTAAEECGLRYLSMENTPRREALSMAERHLISPEFAACAPGSGLLLSDDEGVSVMINEEDHLRLQVLRAGLDLDGAYRQADALDSRLDARLRFAFDKRLGYLTQCPTNLGTGMRASLMLHLPALEERGAIQQLANTVSKLGLTIRGIYGEGSKPEGAMYQLSNQVTLGISELTAIQNLKGIAGQIIREERTAREQLCRNPHFEDRMWRSLGLLRTARLLTHKECMMLLSNLRVGVSMEMLEEVSLDTISELINDVQPATMMSSAGEDLEPEQRDMLRARLVRERLGA